MASKRSRPAKPRLSIGAKLRWAMSILCAAAVLVLAIIIFQRAEQFLIDDERFALGIPEEYGETSPGIRVHGIVHTSRSRVMEVFEKDPGHSMYMFPASERRQSLMAIDWVKDASVSRIWPNSVEVQIRERQPVAFVELPPRRRGAGSRVALVDEDGIVLEQPPGSEYDLPVLRGVREEQAESLRARRVHKMQRFLNEIGELGEQISEIDVSNTDNLAVVLDAGGQAISLMMGDQNYLPRLENFLRHYQGIHRRLPAATKFDLRLDDRITAVDGVINGG